MSFVSTDITDHVATLTIAPPGGRYDGTFLESLGTAATALGADERVRTVVLCSGGDFGLGWSTGALEADDATWAPPLGAAIDAVAAIPQPVIACVTGVAASCGFELALACDIRIAADNARFSFPDTLQGSVPRGGGTQRLPRAVGRAHALRLLLTGEEIDATEALRIGLVSAVVPSAEAAEAGRAMALTIAARGPLATRLAKEAIQRGVEMPLDQALRYELDLTVLLQSTADRAEGVRAFTEKRPPRFIGR